MLIILVILHRHFSINLKIDIMNFSEFQQVLNERSSSTALLLLSLLHSLINEHSLFTSYDCFDLIEDDKGHLMGISVVFDGLLSISDLSLLSGLGHPVYICALDNSFLLRLYI